MKKYTTILIYTFLLFSNFIAFAQDPGEGGGTGGVDPQPAPIDSRIILLAFLGIVYVLYTFRKNKEIV